MTGSCDLVTAGGTYFMISHNLGAEFGGAVEVLFYTVMCLYSWTVTY